MHYVLLSVVHGENNDHIVSINVCEPTCMEWAARDYQQTEMLSLSSPLLYITMPSVYLCISMYYGENNEYIIAVMGHSDSESVQQR